MDDTNFFKITTSEQVSMAAGITACSIGGALMWYDTVLRRSESPSQVFIKFTNPPRRKSSIPKKVTEMDVTPRIFDPKSAQRLRIISILLFFFGSASMFYSFSHYFFPVDKNIPCDDGRDPQEVKVIKELDYLGRAGSTPSL